MMSDPDRPASRAMGAFPRLWRAGACVLSVVSLAGSFYPFTSSECAWFGLAPLLVLARFTAPVSSLCWGWLAGFGFWLVNLWWFLRLGDTGVSPPVAVLAWLALCAYAAVYTGVFLFLASEAFRLTEEPPQWRGDGEEDATGAGLPPPMESQSWPGRMRRMILLAWLPAAWIGLEWLRSTLFTGFPWNTLGVSQYRFTAIIQVAEWGGVYAVSALIVVVNVSAAIMVLRVVDLCRCRRLPRLQVELAVALLLFAACLVWGRSVARREMAEEGRQEKIAIVCVQPAIPQVQKWDDAFTSDITNRLDRLTSLAAMVRPDLVIWPETSIPVGPDATEATWRPFVETYATGGVPVLVGVLEFEQRAPYQVPLCYNNSVLVGTNGAVAGRYTKQHLVPFGEYIPTESWIPALKNLSPLGFSCEVGRDTTVFRLEPKGFTFSSLICFEDIFADLSRAAVRSGAGFLVNQTNDAWFDDSAAPVQHMSHAVFRCVENRVGMVRVANTGVSCFIGRAGEIQDLATMQAVGWTLGASGIVPSRLGVRRGDEKMTFYNRWGDWAFAIPCAAAVVAAAVVAVRRVRREGKRLNVDRKN